MPWLNGPALYLIVFLLFTNGIAGVMWYVKGTEATVYKERVTACAAQHNAFVEQTRAAGTLGQFRMITRLLLLGTAGALKQITIIRHGQTEANVWMRQPGNSWGSPGLRDPGFVDTRLTPEGEAQAIALNERLLADVEPES